MDKILEQIKGSITGPWNGDYSWFYIMGKRREL